MKKLLAVILLTLLSVFSCTTAADGTRKVSKTGIGAGIGAAAGAAIGQVIGKDTKGTLIGTAGGAAVGAAIGNIFDRQEKDITHWKNRVGLICLYLFWKRFFLFRFYVFQEHQLNQGTHN